jgi:transposase
VVIDQAGRKLGEKTTRTTTSEANLELMRWADGFGPDRRFAVEDCRHLSRRLEADLLAAGEELVRVPPKMMAHARDAARTYGKSDPIDALAVARAAWREPDLPVARLDGPTRDLRVLVDHREDLVRERTAQVNRLRWHLHELDPAWDPAPRTLVRFKHLDALATRLQGLEGTVAWVARDLVGRIRELTAAANDLERRIVRAVPGLAPALLSLAGVGALTSAKIVAETADVRRFRSKDAFARHNGTAPLPVWWGNRVPTVCHAPATVSRTRDPSDRRHADADPRCSEGLPRATDVCREHEDGSDQSPQTQTVRRGLPKAARGRGSYPAGSLRRGGLT